MIEGEIGELTILQGEVGDWADPQDPKSVSTEHRRGLKSIYVF